MASDLISAGMKTSDLFKHSFRQLVFTRLFFLPLLCYGLRQRYIDGSNAKHQEEAGYRTKGELW